MRAEREELDLITQPTATTPVRATTTKTKNKTLTK